MYVDVQDGKGESLGASFYSTTIPVWNFVNSTCPVEWHLIVLVSRIEKRGSRDNNFVKWRGTLWSDQPKWPDRSKWITFRAGHEYSGQTKPKWTLPLIWSTNQNFWNFGLKGNKVSLDSSLWRILRFAPRLHTAYLPNYFQLCLLKFCHTLLTNLRGPAPKKRPMISG